ncbi:hypothetical protein BP6252_09615 [Coleophoma cylindrospora]|uniref:DUF7888 domain-containing protein n=1 Tax=Coleophoma cylindrospora TaxID=1849047 RepID=A0A3D8QWC4_9HELO|nr:hypothetical protein BP6252_09615 [Coleophoma cylindrospora]
MKFSAITLLICAALANAAALPQATDGAVNTNIDPSVESHFSGKKGADGVLVAEVDQGTSQALEKRVGALVVVAGIAAVKGVAILTKIAVEIGADTIKNLGQWNSARETFTQKTTLEMWNRNPDYSKYPATVCYNKGYSLKNPAGITGLVSAKLSLGQLFTDYDCMYMTGQNQFYTHSEGGYINLSYRYNGARCSFDQRTGDLTCN